MIPKFHDSKNLGDHTKFRSNGKLTLQKLKFTCNENLARIKQFVVTNCSKE